MQSWRRKDMEVIYKREPRKVVFLYGTSKQLPVSTFRLNCLESPSSGWQTTNCSLYCDYVLTWLDEGSYQWSKKEHSLSSPKSGVDNVYSPKWPTRWWCLFPSREWVCRVKELDSRDTLPLLNLWRKTAANMNKLRKLVSEIHSVVIIFFSSYIAAHFWLTSFSFQVTWKKKRSHSSSWVRVKIQRKHLQQEIDHQDRLCFSKWIQEEKLFHSGPRRKKWRALPE